MVELENVFDDAGETFEKGAKKFKELLKSKPFLIGLGVVCIAGVLVAVRNKGQNEEVSLDESSYTYPTGYAGYPSVGGGSLDEYTGLYGDDFSSILGGGGGGFGESVMDNSTNAELDSLYSELTSLHENITLMSDDYTELTETVLRQSTEIERSAAVAQMQRNSELYNTLAANGGSREQLDALHQENLNIAEAWGFEYDPATGNYFVGNNPVYTTSQQQAHAMAGKAPSVKAPVSYDSNRDYMADIVTLLTNDGDINLVNNYGEQRAAKVAAGGGGSVGYDPNVDYQAAINKAVASGASQSVIDQLTAAREAKIKGENLNADGSKKSGSSGSSGSSTSSKKSSTSTSSKTSAASTSSKNTGSNNSGSKSTTTIKDKSTGATVTITKSGVGW